MLGGTQIPVSMMSPFQFLTIVRECHPAFFLKALSDWSNTLRMTSRMPT